MDEQQQQRVNEAAEKFANALRESYQTVASRGESAQQLNAEMTQRFFNTVINHLQRHAEANVQVGEELAGQEQRRQEAFRQLTQESVQAYMGFINSLFSYAQTSSLEAAQRGTIEAQETPIPTPTTTEASPERQEGAEVPLEGYDSLNIEQITERLDDLSTQELRQLRAYEAENKSRSTLLRRLDERIEADASSS
jgi:hypothetical protein